MAKQRKKIELCHNDGSNCVEYTVSFADDPIEKAMVYEARGCFYDLSEKYFDWDDVEGQGFGQVVSCINKNEEMLWSSSAHAYPKERVIDIIRQARANAEEERY